MTDDTTRKLVERMVESAREEIINAPHKDGVVDYDIAARGATAVVLSVLAEYAPGTPEYAVEFDFEALAEQVEQRL